MDFASFSHASAEPPPRGYLFLLGFRRFGRSGYGRHLAAYQPLFRQLNSFRFLYISPKTSHFQSAEQRFRAGVERRLESDVTAELLWYFEIRRKWEDREYIVPVDLEFLSEASAVFMASAAMVPIPRGTPVTSPKKLSARSSARCTSTHCKFRDRLRRRPPILSRMERKPGERSMKDAVHPHVHRSVHPGGERKCWGALGLCSTRRTVWARAKHRTGLERPHFLRFDAPKKKREVVPAQFEEAAPI